MSEGPHPGPVRPSDLPNGLSDIILRLVEGWTPKPGPSRTATRLVWQGMDLSGEVKRVYPTREALLIECIGARGFGLARETRKGDASLVGTLDDGTVFFSEYAHVTNARIGSRGDSWTLSAPYWEMRMPEPSPRYWVGRISGDAVFVPGNLDTRVAYLPGGGHTHIVQTGGHLTVDGCYPYYMVWRGVDGRRVWHLVVDASAETSVDHDKLYADLLCLQFSIGRRLRVDSLAGLTPGGEVVAWRGARLGKEPGSSQHHEPVPSQFSRELWAAALFRLLSHAYQNRPALKLFLPLGYWLDALDDHIDGQYLRLHVALRAFSNAVLAEKNASLPSLAADQDTWMVWVDAHSDEIRSQAGPGGADALVSATKAAACGNGSAAVLAAFTSLGLELPADGKREIEAFDNTVNNATMSPVPLGVNTKRSNEVVEDNLRRLAMVRTLVVSLVARAVDYRGPITGWHGGPGAYEPLVDPGLWSEPDSETKRLAGHVTHVTKVHHRPRSTASWPTFEPLTLPSEGLIPPLASFIESLGDATGGRVIGRLEPILPEQGSEARRFDAKLVLSRTPQTQSLLFTATEIGGAIRVAGWSEEVADIATIEQVDAFAESIAKSPYVIRRIYQMLSFDTMLASLDTRS